MTPKPVGYGREMADDDVDLDQPEERAERVPDYRGTGIVPAVVVGIVLAAALIAFVAQNSRSVALDWLWLDFRTSPAVLVLAALFVGVVADEVLGLFFRRARRRRLAERERLARVADGSSA